tara:strand:+ start:1071 stop:1535 length:465 start_codon:yes stop_codon:yes gene_type:complete
MFRVILVLVILVLIVILRNRLNENFSSLSNIVGSTGLDSMSLINNANGILQNNDVPLGSAKVHTDILDMLVHKSIDDNNERKEDLFQSEPLDEDIDEPEFYIKLMGQNHQIFTESANQRMLCDNLMNELRKLAKNSAPISNLKRRYNNIENPIE